MYLTFNHPQYLWYLFSIPLLVLSHFVFLKYTRGKAIRFANFQALKRVSQEKVITRNYPILLIRILILACLILAITGTTFWYEGLSTQNNYVIALDTSSSMTAQDLKPTRLDAAKDYGKIFIDNLAPDSSVVVVSFSGAAFIEQLPTKNKLESKQSVSDLAVAYTGGTDIPGALITSTNLLLTSKHGRTIILITDGSNTAGYFTKDPIAEGVRYCRQNSVMVHAIGLGTNSGPIGYLPEYYNISSVYDENTMKRIANETGGSYHYVSTNEELQDAYAAIMEDSKESYIGVDLSLGLLIIALLLIFLEWALMNTKFRAVP